MWEMFETMQEKSFGQKMSCETGDMTCFKPGSEVVTCGWLDDIEIPWACIWCIAKECGKCLIHCKKNPLANKCRDCLTKDCGNCLLVCGLDIGIGKRIIRI